MRMDSTYPLRVVDIETTGRDPKEDRIIELAVAAFPEGLLCPHKVKPLVIHHRFRVDVDVLPDALECHGISRKDTTDCPPFAMKASSLRDMFQGAQSWPLIVGHNVDFDIAFLEAEFKRAGVETGDTFRNRLDTKQGSRMYLPDQDIRASLDQCLEFFKIGGRRGVHHGAMEDVVLTSKLLYKLILAGDIGPREAQHRQHYPESINVLMDKAADYYWSPDPAEEATQWVERELPEGIKQAKAMTDELIEEREVTHGSFRANSRIMDDILVAITNHGKAWDGLSHRERVAFIYIAGKISRYMSEPRIDHLSDIMGYARLAQAAAQDRGVT